TKSTVASSTPASAVHPSGSGWYGSSNERASPSTSGRSLGGQLSIAGEVWRRCSSSGGAANCGSAIVTQVRSAPGGTTAKGEAKRLVTQAICGGVDGDWKEANNGSVSSSALEVRITSELLPRQRTKPS